LLLEVRKRMSAPRILLVTRNLPPLPRFLAVFARKMIAWLADWACRPRFEACRSFAGDGDWRPFGNHLCARSSIQWNKS
jgi:hypothetical protein